MCHWWPLPVLLMFLRKYNHTKWREDGVVCGQGNGGGGGGGSHSTLVVLSLNEVLKLNWLHKWLMCIMELGVALHKGIC